MSRRVLWMVLAGASLLLAGCGDLGEVVALHTVADGLREALPPVSADFFASCERRARIAAEMGAGNPGSEAAGPGATATGMPGAAATGLCAPSEAVGAQLGADESVLVAYLEALSRLGSGAAFTYGKALGANLLQVNSLAVSPGMNEAVAGDAQRAGVAALTLTVKLADLATQHIRVRDARRIVMEANPGVQALTAALYAAGDVDYSLLLENEKGLLVAYYEGPIAAAGPGDRLTSMLVQRQYDGDLQRWRRRRAAAAAYGVVMQQIGVLHADLAQAARDSAGFPARVQALAPEVSRLNDAIASLQTEERMDGEAR